MSGQSRVDDLTESLRGAVFWLETLIEAAGVDPDETVLKVTVKDGVEIDVSLSDGLSKFKAALAQPQESDHV